MWDWCLALVIARHASELNATDLFANTRYPVYCLRSFKYTNTVHHRMSTPARSTTLCVGTDQGKRSPALRGRALGKLCTITMVMVVGRLRGHASTCSPAGMQICLRILIFRAPLILT